MEELFQKLEVRIRSLLNKCEHLAKMNDHLQNHNKELNRVKTSINDEKHQLLTKNQLVIHQIEQMVQRLKSMETANES